MGPGDVFESEDICCSGPIDAHGRSDLISSRDPG